ncbi:MAG TPA: glycosyltransferase family 2 protein [Rhodopila sp.]|uniref:glycosyltransferase family 2 protein n=1 Tax=Rhodopila sp. TaxID=2480087 RepID=UPI002C708D01|nr:glycosyltransferase family 2 protein [Rhodopila sp.]HVY16843.1 glycosyltransferase family 2 protein [Rhodopila sp.]
MPRYRYALVACARWEEMAIQEWAAYHYAIGFEHIYLYSNDDDPEALLRAVMPWVIGPNPLMTFRHWPAVGQQMQIYLHFLENFKSETEWFSFLDIDEFLVLKGVNNIDAFMRDYTQSVDSLYFHWLPYGNCGRRERATGSTLISYPRRAERLDPHTKHICRSAVLDHHAIRRGYEAGQGSFHHFLDNYHLPDVRCADVLLTPMDGYAKNFPEMAAPFVKRPGFSEAAIARAYVAHFQFRSETDFLRRWQRGGFPNGDTMRDLYDSGGYRTILKANNAVYDTYLAEFWWRCTAAVNRPSLQPASGAPPLDNVAVRKPTFQSSVYDPQGHPEPAKSRTMDGANSGFRTGTYGFHTALEPQPWWCVDLLWLHRIREIHIYNRMDDPAVLHRAAHLQVWAGAGTDTSFWTLLLDRSSDEPFGADRLPLVVKVEQDRPFRFIRIGLADTNYLHLDEVEVYGKQA